MAWQGVVLWRGEPLTFRQNRTDRPQEPSQGVKQKVSVGSEQGRSAENLLAYEPWALAVTIPSHRTPSLPKSDEPWCNHNLPVYFVRNFQNKMNGWVLKGLPTGRGHHGEEDPPRGDVRPRWLAPGGAQDRVPGLHVGFCCDPGGRAPQHPAWREPTEEERPLCSLSSPKMRF